MIIKLLYIHEENKYLFIKTAHVHVCICLQPCGVQQVSLIARLVGTACTSLSTQVNNYAVNTERHMLVHVLQNMDLLLNLLTQ